MNKFIRIYFDIKKPEPDLFCKKGLTKNFLNSPFKLQGIGGYPIPLRLVWRAM